MDERRQHRRLVIRLPIECSSPEGGRDGRLRANTANISTGGLYFEVDVTDDVPAPIPSTFLNIDLTVPPGEGHFPYEGRISSTAEILRCHAEENGSPSAQGGRRVGVAARFCEPLKLEF